MLVLSSSKKANDKLTRGRQVIWRQLLRYKHDVITLTVLGTASSIAGGVIPFLVGRFLDGLITLDATVSVLGLFVFKSWLWWLALWVVVQLVFDGLDWVYARRNSAFTTFLRARYMVDGFGKLLRHTVAFHKEKKTGDIGETINRASDGIANMMEWTVFGLAPELLSIVVGIVIAVWINWALAAVLLAGIVVYIAILMRVVPKMVRVGKRGDKLYRIAYGDAYEALYAVETVKQFTAEEREEARLKKNFIDRAASHWVELEYIWSNISAYQRLVVTATRFAIFALSIWYIGGGTLTIGELVMFNGYAAIVFGPLAQLGMRWRNLQRGLISAEAGDKVLSAQGEVYTPDGVRPLPRDFKGEVSFEHVSFAYGKRDPKVLQDVSFTTRPGETLALVGESGQGKSTLIQLLSGYYFPTKGRILVDGVDIREVALLDLRSRIAIVSQEITLFNDTIERNLKYGAFTAGAAQVTRAAREAYAHEFIAKFPKGLKTLVGERGVKLSVGQKQRVAIARAILRDPKILILDEPTSALDLKTELQITESLEKLMQGRTTFIIAHRLSTVRKADRILVLHDGGIVEEGNHEALMKIEGGHYKKLYDLHVGLQ